MDNKCITAGNLKKNINYNREIFVYNNIYNHCSEKIIEQNGRGIEYCIYIPPGQVFGETIYNRNTCLSFLIKKLRNKGFDVLFEQPDKIIISWFDSSKRKHEIETNKFLCEENKKTQKYLGSGTDDKKKNGGLQFPKISPGSGE